MTHAGGRPTKLSPEIIAEAQAFVDGASESALSPGTIMLQIAADKNAGADDKPQHTLPTVERLALHLKISRSTLDEWVKLNEDFAYIVDRLRLKKSDQLQQGGITGAYNPSVTKLLLGPEGYADRSQSEQTNNGNVTVEVVNYADKPDTGEQQDQSTS